MKVVVLAGGVGKRMENILAGRPKSMVNILGKPIIYYILTALSKLNLWDVVLITDKPRYFEGPSLKLPSTLDVKIVTQKKPEIEGALLAAEELLKKEERFLLVFGSVVTDLKAYQEVLDASKYYKYNLLVVPEQDLTGLDVVKTDINNFVVKVSSEGEGYAFGGIAVLPTNILNLIKSDISLNNAITEIAVKNPVKAVLYDGWWIDIKVPWDVLRASYYLLNDINESRISVKAKISSKAIIEGPVIIEDGAEIDHGVIIKGPAYIGKDVFVGLNSVIRNYTDLEQNVMVGSFNEITWSLILNNAVISRNCFISFSVVGYEAILEPNVVTLSILKESIKIERPLRVSRKGREFVKLGAVIGSGKRVHAGKLLKPAEVI